MSFFVSRHFALLLESVLHSAYRFHILRVFSVFLTWDANVMDPKLTLAWIKRDQLDVTCFIISLFNAQHVSDVNTSILRSLRLICWVISWVVLLWLDVCWSYIVVWLGWCGIRMQATWCNLLFFISLFNAQHVSDVNTSETCWALSTIGLFHMNRPVVLQPASGYHTTPAKPQRNTNTHPTRAIQPMTLKH